MERKCDKCGIVTENLFCPECNNLITSERKLKNFEKGWKEMCSDLENEKEFLTTGGRKSFTIWHPGGEKLRYKKSTGDICDLPKSEFNKAYEILKETDELDKTTPYHKLMHGSYYPPLLKTYFVKIEG